MSSEQSRRGLEQPPTEEYESPLPECKATATVDPHGIVRLDMSRERVAVHADRFRDQLDAHPGDSLIPVIWILPNRAYKHLADNIGRLNGTAETGAVQVIADEEPDISVSVILNESQIAGLSEDLRRDYEDSPDDKAYGWRVSLSQTVLELLVDQFIAAMKGADDPVEAVDDR